MHHLRPALVLIALFTILTGIVLPIAFTGAATALAPSLAGGSLIERNGQIVGSILLGQNFASDRYFHPRPSATTDTDPNDSTKTIAAPYNASNSNGSNLAPTSKALIDRVRGDIAALHATGRVPADMVTTSASGLDPDISPQNARLQIARVARARHVSEAVLQSLVAAHMREPLLGFIGEPRVNVLELNLALDATAHP